MPSAALTKEQFETIKDERLKQAIELNTDLLNALEKQDIDNVAALLKQGADVNAQYANGETCLHLAVRVGVIEIACLLLEKGADVNAKESFFQQTPLHLAVLSNNLAMVKLLIDSDNILAYSNNFLVIPVDLCQQDFTGSSALNCAKVLAENGGATYQEMIAVLQKAANQALENELISLNALTEKAQQLLQAGADINTALQYAKDKENSELAAAIEDYAAGQSAAKAPDQTESPTESVSNIQHPSKSKWRWAGLTALVVFGGASTTTGALVLGGVLALSFAAPQVVFTLALVAIVLGAGVLLATIAGAVYRWNQHQQAKQLDEKDSSTNNFQQVSSPFTDPGLPAGKASDNIFTNNPSPLNSGLLKGRAENKRAPAGGANKLFVS